MKLLKISIVPLLVAAAVLLINCTTKNDSSDQPQTPPAGEYNLVVAFPGLPAFASPVELTSPSDGTDRIFVVAQKGIIHAFANKGDVKDAAVFLDITAKVTSGGEMGLLGLAFHPNYKSNGYFYVNYTRRQPSLETVISRFKVSATNPNVADPNSEEVLLTYAQPYSNHNGGKVAFGNDNFLYVSAGDGGSGGDPQGNGQNKAALLGKILRIDVDKTESGKKYAIPTDNPFKGNTEGFKEEIYAYGMRNAWRFNFDRTTGLLWAADVGQNKTEEIDIIEKGGNYGWNTMEAEECFKSGNCDKAGLLLPIWTYGRSSGTSITGGYVCRDTNLPGLTGKYIYGDYTTGNIWALTYADKKAVTNTQIANAGTASLSSFGEDSKNNLYVLNHQDGKVYKLVAGK